LIQDEEALPIIYKWSSTRACVVLGRLQRINVAGAIRLAKQSGPARPSSISSPNYGATSIVNAFNPGFLASKKLQCPELVERA